MFLLSISNYKRVRSESNDHKLLSADKFDTFSKIIVLEADANHLIYTKGIDFYHGSTLEQSSKLPSTKITLLSPPGEDG